MSSIDITPKVLKGLLENKKYVDDTLKVAPLARLNVLQEFAGQMCTAQTDLSGEISREDILKIYNTALTLLTNEQKDNLEKWWEPRASTVANCTYRNLQWLHCIIKNDWKPLPTPPTSS